MRTLRPIVSTVLCLVLVLTTVPAAPQAPAAQPDTQTIKVDVSEVVLDFVVRDKKGKPIRDLKPDEIEIYEDGQRQTATALRLIEGKEAITAADQQHATLDPLRQLRLVSLVFENMDAESMRIARDAANELVKREVDQNVYYAIFRINPTLRTVQSFTRDKAVLRRAILEATSGVQQTGGGQQGKLEKGSDVAPAKDVEGATGPAAAAMGSDFAAQAMARAIQRMEQFLNDSTSNQQGNMTLTSLLALVKGQQSLAGRKTALFFCGGLWLDQNLLPFYETLLGEANRTNFTFYGLDAKGLVTWGQNSAGADDLISDVKRAQDALKREGGAATVADMKATDKQMEAGLKNMQLNLVNLSAGTGGFAITDTNDFKQPMTRITEDLWTYFEASYRPVNQNLNGEFRKLEIRCKRPNTVVQGRIGYFALPPEFREVMFPWEVSILKSFGASPAPKDIVFRSHAFQFGESQGLVKGVLDMEMEHKVLNPAKNSDGTKYLAHFSLVALVKDANGQVVRKFQKDIPFSFPSDKLDAFKIGMFNFAEPFELPAGAYLVEAAIKDRLENKVGVEKFPLKIAAVAGGPRLSSLAMVRRVDPVQTANVGGDPFRVDKNKITPDLDAKIPAVQGSNINIFCVVYGQKGGPKPELFLEFMQNGQSVGKLPAPLPEMDAQGQIPYIATIPAANFPAGNWEVRATAMQGGKPSNIETVKFAIVPPGTGGN